MIGDLAFLGAPALAFLVAAGSPGPATLAVAGTAMAAGRRAGLAIGAGLSIGLAFWGALTALGLGALVIGSPPALVALRIGGGLYLLWLAWKSARAAWTGAPPATAGAVDAPLRLALRGLALNLSNPKAALAWAAVIALGLPPGAGPGHLAAIAATCSAIGLLVYVAYALGFAAAPVRRAYARARRAVEAALAAVFAGAGLKLILDRSAAP